MRMIFAVLMMFALVAATSAIAQARGTPPSEQPFAIVKVSVSPDAPVVSSVPPLTVGYDVIQNLSESKTLKLSVTTERRGQSTTVAESNSVRRPEIVLLALNIPTSRLQHVPSRSRSGIKLGRLRHICKNNK